MLVDTVEGGGKKKTSRRLGLFVSPLDQRSQDSLVKLKQLVNVCIDAVCKYGPLKKWSAVGVRPTCGAIFIEKKVCVTISCLAVLPLTSTRMWKA